MCIFQSTRFLIPERFLLQMKHVNDLPSLTSIGVLGTRGLPFMASPALERKEA